MKTFCISLQINYYFASLGIQIARETLILGHLICALTVQPPYKNTNSGDIVTAFPVKGGATQTINFLYSLGILWQSEVLSQFNLCMNLNEK